jgi:NitT/TauT family transport system substrate-binding protein
MFMGLVAPIGRCLVFAAVLSGLWIQTVLAAGLTKVTIVLSTSDQDVSYEPYGPYAQQMGWYKDAGLDVVIQTAPTTGQVIQLLLSGNAQFGQVTPDADLLAAQTQPLPIKIVYAMARKQIWAAAVRPDSQITTFGGLKGRVIGYPSESPAIAAFVDARMHDDGASQADTKSIATGYGVTSMEALKSGRIDAFIAWPGLFAAFQNAGYQFTVLPDAPWQSGYYGIGQGATNDYIAAHPDIIAKIGRGIAMSAVVLKTHPEAMVRAFWKAYPARAPLPGDDEALAMKKELNILHATAGQMRIDELPADFAWGSQDEATWDRHMTNLLNIGLATKRLDPSAYFTNAFAQQFNDFDHAALMK